MTDRDRLIELIDEAINDEETSYSNIADYLLENGVIVPPCKVGDTVYWAYKSIPLKPELLTGKIFAIGIDENLIMWVSVRYTNGLTFYHNSNDFEKFLYLNRSAAEQALKGGVE